MRNVETRRGINYFRESYFPGQWKQLVSEARVNAPSKFPSMKVGRVPYDPSLLLT